MSKEQLENNKTQEEKEGKGKNLLGKFVCALLSLILWVYVSYDKNPDSSKTFTNIPVSLAGIEVLEGRNLTVLTSDMYASVKLSGTRNILSKVNKNDIKAVVNVSDITTVGGQNPMLTISGIPDALSVDERRITTGTLVTDNLVKKSLDLNIEFTGKMDDSVVEGEKTVFPTYITVKGPGTVLENISAWTEAIDISNVKQSENTFNTGIVLKNASGEVVKSNMITVSDTSATVTLNCQGKKELSVIAPEIVGSRTGYNITVERIEPETVVVTGPLEEIGLMDGVELGPIDALYAHDSMRCELILPENIACETTKVTVMLKIEPLEEVRNEEEEATDTEEEERVEENS